MSLINCKRCFRISVATAPKTQLRVDEAFKLLIERSAKLLNEDSIKQNALANVSQNGIIFIDEMDKIVRTQGMHSGGEVSREGVQRDLLPLIEAVR